MRKRQKRPVDPDTVGGQAKPRLEYGSDAPSSQLQQPLRDEDPEIWRVYDAIRNTPGAVALLGEVIRDTLDQIYDGQWTGRWDYRQLNKTEKTHVGTLIQINVQKALGLVDGERLDYKIAGVEVDCKWSMSMGGWEIPQEMYCNWGPQIALVIWGNDYTSRWAAGLVRTEESYLRPVGKQRDKKRRLNEAGLSRIIWLQPGGDLVPNTLLRLSAEQRARILGSQSGQACVNSLFYEVQGQLVDRATVLTAAMQADSLKRVRDARKHLRAYGIVIFGHYAPHPDLATRLGLPRPELGSFVSARLVPADVNWPDAKIEIQGGHWRLAEEGDPVATAPELPEQGREKQLPVIAVP